MWALFAKGVARREKVQHLQAVVLLCSSTSGQAALLMFR
jgi:hypothetical protein